MKAVVENGEDTRVLVLAPSDLPMLSSGKPDLKAIEELFDA